MPSASKPRVLAMAGKLVASVAMDPGQGSTASETRGGIGIHQELYLQVKTHLCTGCAHEGQGRTAPCPPNVTPLESLPSCSARLPQAPSIQIPIARKSLPAFFPPSLPSLAPVRPGALLSIFLQGQAVLSCLSYLLCPLPFGPFLWGACFVVPSPAGSQACQTCPLWALAALLLVAQNKSVLPAQPGGHPTPGAAQNHPARTQGSPGPRALE